MDIPNTLLEEKYWDENMIAAGIDEAGRGPIAGPVVAAAVIISRTFNIPGIRDSKILSRVKRESLYNLITTNAISYGIGVVEPEEIDRINILNASLKAMNIAFLNLEVRPDVLLIDGINKIEMDIEQHTIIKGDNKCTSIACASIIAKVTRDRIMDSYDIIYPLYKFSKHKGYPTREHYDILKRYGVTDIHRKTFKGVL